MPVLLHHPHLLSKAGMHMMTASLMASMAASAVPFWSWIVNKDVFALQCKSCLIGQNKSHVKYMTCWYVNASRNIVEPLVLCHAAIVAPALQTFMIMSQHAYFPNEKCLSQRPPWLASLLLTHGSVADRRSAVRLRERSQCLSQNVACCCAVPPICLCVLVKQVCLPQLQPPDGMHMTRWKLLHRVV